MDKIKISRTLNRWTGGEDELLCYRIYTQARIRGGFWLASEKTINVIFYLLRGERFHVKMNHRWEEQQMTKRSDLEKLDGLVGVQLHEFEFDHQPLEEEDEVSKCTQCRQLVTEAEAVIVKKFYGGFSSEITFCTEDCATTFYINRLREVDGR